MTDFPDPEDDPRLETLPLVLTAEELTMVGRYWPGTAVAKGWISRPIAEKADALFALNLVADARSKLGLEASEAREQSRRRKVGPWAPEVVMAPMPEPMPEPPPVVQRYQPVADRVVSQFGDRPFSYTGPSEPDTAMRSPDGKPVAQRFRAAPTADRRRKTRITIAVLAALAITMLCCGFGLSEALRYLTEGIQ